MRPGAPPPAPHRSLRGATARVLLLLAVLALLAPGAGAEDPKSREALAEKSLPLRTALHYDPSLGSPFDRLIELYRKADRVDDLVALYQAHLQQFPADVSGRVVHVRLLLATSDPEAARQVRAAVEQHPDSAYLQYLLYTRLDDDGDPRALDALAKAISLEKIPGRKRAWVERLLTQALAEDRRDLASAQLGTLAELMGGDAAAHLAAARKMHEFGLHTRALKELEAARTQKPAPELGVEIDLFAALLEVALGERGKAADRLDGLLDRLTADYWRRPEILRRRARLVSSAAERDAMLADARKRSEAHPDDESIALDLARLLGGFERPREALQGLLAAGVRMPASQRIEQEILGLYDRLRDESGRAEYLEARLQVQPDRQDLRERLAQAWFLMGRTDAATKLLERVLEPLAEDVRIARMLETARFLRSRGLQESAARLYERVVQLSPARLDVRREWAECHLAIGDRGTARQVLAAPIPPEVPGDVFLDLVQLLVSQRLYTESRAVLRTRAETHPDDLDVQLMLIHVEAGLGYASSSARRIAAVRPLADTAARYRRWLEEAVSFHRFYDGDLEFLDAEQARLVTEEGWSKSRLGRLEAFADVSADADRVEPVAVHMQELMEGKLPEEVRVRLRRKLAAMLESAGRSWFRRNKAHLGAAARELQELIDEDPDYEHEYRARLALIHVSNERLDLARPILERVDVRKLTEPGILDRLVRAHTELGDGPRVLRTMERLTIVEPSERDHWERWIAALVLTGDERTLRSALRRLLRGVPRMKLSRDSKDELQAHLSDSYWRSIARLVGRRTEASQLEALAMLDEVERLSAADELPLWVAWTRAFLHNRMQRIEARDEAMGELDRLMKQRLAEAEAERAQEADEAKAAGKKPQDPATAQAAIEDVKRVHFPDGLGVSWTAARALLTRAPSKAPERPRPSDRTGPEQADTVRWMFETAGGDPVASVQPLGNERALISDAKGNVYGLDRESGKVLFELIDRWRVGTAPSPNPQAAMFEPVPVPVLGPDATFCLQEPGRVTCYGPDGEIRWVGDLYARDGQTTHVEVVAGPHDVYAYDPHSGQVACFRAVDGRVRWLTRLESAALSVPSARGQGIALRGNRLLVYGPRTAVLDTKAGAVMWTFEPNRVRQIPINLEEADEELDALFGRRHRRVRKKRKTAATTPPPPPAYAGYPGMPPAFLGRRGRIAYPPGFYPGMVYPGSPYAAGGFAVAPAAFVPAPARSPSSWSPKRRPSRTAVVARAVHWATPVGNNQYRLGLLVGSRLLLFRDTFGASGSALVMDLDLPMFAEAVAIDGTPIGTHGRRVCVLQNGRLVVWNLDRNAQTVVELGAVSGDQKWYRLQATLDNGFAYLTGPGGVLCTSLSGERQMFVTPWSDKARPEKQDAASQGAFTLRGVSLVRGQTGYESLLRPTGFTAGRTLFTISDPQRVVALGDSAHRKGVPANGDAAPGAGAKGEGDGR